MTINNRKKGAEGEKIACEYLLNKGYNILETNYHYEIRTSFGSNKQNEVGTFVHGNDGLFGPF